MTDFDEEHASEDDIYNVRNSLSRMNRDLEIHMEMQNKHAQLIAARFKAYMAHGFDRAEALQLIIHRGIM
jgi:hypothetical protein